MTWDDDIINILYDRIGNLERDIEESTREIDDKREEIKKNKKEIEHLKGL